MSRLHNVLSMILMQVYKKRERERESEAVRNTNVQFRERKVTGSLAAKHVFVEERLSLLKNYHS